MTSTMSKKHFPIRNDAACVYKWAWNTFRLYNGHTSSCHRIKTTYVDIDEFDNFHNTSNVIAARTRMAAGKWPEPLNGCEYCKDVEQNGGISDRLYSNNIAELTPVDFSEDPSAPVTPRIVEIYLHNTCDLACVYCIPLFSSKINEEIKKFGPMPVGIKSLTANINRDLYFEKFLSWFDTNRSKLQRLSILGGEPLLQKEFWFLLDRLRSQDNLNLELAINTNLNAESKTLEKFISKIYDLLKHKKIKRVDISCSLDCWGEQAEFVRYGLNLAQWQQNFEELIKHKWLYINVHQVLTSLTIPTALELQDKLTEYKKVNKSIVQAYHMVDGDNLEIYHPGIFGNNFFNKQMEILVDRYPIAQEWDNVAKSRLIGFAKLLQSSTIEPVRLQKLKNTLNEIDRRRNTNWISLFPDINNFFIEHNI